MLSVRVASALTAWELYVRSILVADVKIWGILENGDVDCNSGSIVDTKGKRYLLVSAQVGDESELCTRVRGFHVTRSWHIQVPEGWV